MGMVRRPLREGDMICVVLGCNVPMVLRKAVDDHHLVGPCFVWGLMDGEALENMRGSGYEEFRLR
jgi:di/tripeptidase